MEQLQAAEQAAQGFVDKMHQIADSTDDQTKSELTQALTNDIMASKTKILKASIPNQVDDVSSWYSMGSEIGRGTFGLVRLATHRLSGTSVAIKSYSRLHAARSCLPVDKRFIGDSGGDALEWRRVRQEVNLLSRLRAHLSVMRFIESFETQTRVHVVTELVQGTNLCEVLQRTSGQRLTEPRAKRIFVQLVEAVEALHGQNVIHRDLKLENILVDEDSGHATIIDFGFSDLEEIEPQASDCTKRTKKKNFCGTPAYMAPEVVASERYDGKPVDIWSLGVLLYVMLCGKFPFQGVSFHQLYQKLRSGAQQLLIPSALSSEARTLLQSVLTLNPAKRPSASELLCCSWLQSVQTPQLGNMLKLSFEAWPGTRQTICKTLAELYGVQLKDFDLDHVERGSRHTRLGSFLGLATAVSYHHFQRLVKAASLAQLLSSEDNQMQQRESTGIEVSTRHKEQLEKLIGLVKSSLITS
ncbi:hypothetical protein V7S43_006138 [Phytophthora oleae]|uniref:Protein kinase domain-containing protein n=1 Tax=Phytophthora oleae TaxID=2107226 RepID=A0ABD3FT27_9STRA